MPRCPSCHRRLLERTTCPRDGQVPTETYELRSESISPEPPTIDGYAFGETLGSGGFAFVWAAKRIDDGVPVAIKIGHSGQSTVVERFYRESVAQKSIGAPFAPQWYASGTVAGKPYIVMERVIGKTLAKRIAEVDSSLALKTIQSIAAQVAAALDTLHGHDLVHRDIKPENIIVTDDGSRAVLLDYGLTKKAEIREFEFRSTQLTSDGFAVGTPEYMAPEVIRGIDIADPRADIYAFGILLYELFTLRVPFVGSGGLVEHGHLSLRPPRPSDFMPVPLAWEQLILSCLAKDPSRRPASMSIVRRLIEHTPIESESTTQNAFQSRNSSIPPPSVSAPRLLAEGRHPTVILYAEVAGPGALISNRIRQHRGHVVRQRGLTYTAIFSGFDAADPAGSALSAAREILQENGRVALHLENVTIRRKERGAPTAYGAAIERPETWIPAKDWHGLSMTEQLRQAIPPALLSTKSTPQGLSRETTTNELPLRSAQNTTDDALEAKSKLIGRDEETTTLDGTLQSSFQKQLPWLVTIIGDTGLGKTRIATEAVEACRRAFPATNIISIAIPPAGIGDGTSETDKLLRTLLDAPESPPADRRTFFLNALGEEIGLHAADFLGASLGWNVAPKSDGTVHRMRAIAHALRQLARKGPVAIIVDDAHRADDALLDALEYATLDGQQLPLWVLLTAAPAFDEQRRTWGRRTRYFTAMRLAPLANESAKELAAELLLPAEYPPAAVLERLASWAGGNPFCLLQIVRALKRLGIVRQREHGGSYYVATADVENLPPIPAWQWIAVRQMDQMPLELAACARLCAVLGVTFTRTELEHIQDELDRAGEAGTPLDMDVALGALRHRRLLQCNKDGEYSFQNGALEDAIYQLVDPAQRQKVHRHAFVWWKQVVESMEKPSAEALEKLGRHAAALGEKQDAFAAYMQLAKIAAKNHKDTDADRLCSIAIAQTPDGDSLSKARALLGRGRSRYRVSRVQEALADFQQARMLAEERQESHLQAETLLEEATALDWSREFAASAERASQAANLIDEIGAKDLLLKQRVAEGRVAFRFGRTNESIALFDRAIADAKTCNDYDALVITLLLTASQLAFAGRLDEAEERFREVIELAETANDRVHLCAAHANRVALWFGRRAQERAMQDLHRAIDLAREIGNPWLERLAAHNIATLLHWSGERAGALEFGRRAQLLTERFFEPAFITSSLLLARINLTVEAFDDALRLYRWITQSYDPERSSAPRALWNYRLIGLVVAAYLPDSVHRTEIGGTWEDVIRAAAADTEKELALEVLYWRIRTALHETNAEEARNALTHALQRLNDCPLWRSDFAALEKNVQQLERSETP